MLIHVAFIVYSWYHYHHGIFTIFLQHFYVFCSISFGCCMAILLMFFYSLETADPCHTCHGAFRVCFMLIYITYCSILPMFVPLTIAWLLMQSLCFFIRFVKSPKKAAPTGEAHKIHNPYMLDNS